MRTGPANETRRGRERNAAFFSFAVIAMASLALFFFAGLAFSSKDYRDAALYGLEARKVSMRAQDAQRYMSAIFDDAIVDSAYKAYGCNYLGTSPPAAGTCPAFVTELTNSFLKGNNGPAPYLRAAANLSGDGITVQLFDFSTGSTVGGVVWCVAPSAGYNFTAQAFYPGTFFVYSTHANKSFSFNITKDIDIALRVPINAPVNDPTRFEARITNTSYNRTYSWLANCTPNN